MTIRVGAWNVEYGRGAERNRLRRAHLLATDADVWVLTETSDALDLSRTHRAMHSTPRPAPQGGRWTTIWTRLPPLETLATADPSRCVAARLDAGAFGEIVVFGTVLPWLGDPGPDGERPARGWDEFQRVTPLQGAEWAALRAAHPDATLLVAGDLNQDLDGPHFYGSNACRATLRAALAGADLRCLTGTDKFAPGELRHPPIDHVCAAPPRGARLEVSVRGWDHTVDGVRLSDHGGVVVEIARSIVTGS